MYKESFDYKYDARGEPGACVILESSMFSGKYEGLEHAPESTQEASDIIRYHQELPGSFPDDPRCVWEISRNGAKHSPPGAKITKARGPPLCIPGDPLSQVIMCQMIIKLTILISDYNDF